METRRTRQAGNVISVGGLLTAGLLDRVRNNAKDVPALSEEAYHLLKGERFGEVTTRSWTRLQAAWITFQVQLGALDATDATATTVTRERFLLPLFEELGYGRLQTARAMAVDDRTFAVSHSWNEVPIHLVGARVPLDRRSAHVRGAASQSPHGLVQDYLNRSDAALWGFVSNGLSLRLLRDNASLTRQAYVEFDLEAIFEGQSYADFVLLWLVGHESRLEGERPERCALEQWRQHAAQAGTRALDRLRDGVEQAITTLGRGFLEYSTNTQLREAIKSGELDGRDYYRELLRVVYRLIFLFVAEDRGALLHPDASAEARSRYRDHYSTTWLRTLAVERRGSRHPDLWRAFQLVAHGLGSRTGVPQLGVPALGGFLFGASATPHLDRSDLSNGSLLEAIRSLALIEDRGVRLAVDFRNLGSEELGSIYESLLAFHPEVHPDAAAFELASAAGSERKTTGSYYTPTSLISDLLDSALEPVLAEAVAGKSRDDAERAILELRVVDPAVGSGHFLVAAAHRIARRLAAARLGDIEPSPVEHQHALRDVVGRCLYGVDLNPDAAELCRVGLWLEAIEPGRPLSFLDNHIRVGNSLLGTTPEMLAGYIPDDAYVVLGEDDDKARVRDLFKRNREERGGQLTLDESSLVGVDPELAQAALAINELPDDDLADVEQKARRYEGLVESGAYRTAKLLADAWCAAFVVPKSGKVPGITSATLRRIARNATGVEEATRAVIDDQAGTYQFFHWHLEFPDIFPPEGPDAGVRHGFDVVLGNPPWERFKLQEEEFFAVPRPDIAKAANAAARKRMIARLREEDPPLYRAYVDALRSADGASHIVRDSGRFPLGGRGDVNTYPVFAELMRSILAPTGRVGVIVPTGIATDDTTKFLFRDLVDSGSLVSLFDFENRKGIFPAIDSRIKFSLLTLAGHARPAAESEFVFFALGIDDLTDPERRFTLAPADFALLNPNTRTCPIFRSRRDAEITKGIYERLPVLVNESKGEDGNPWGITFMSMFHMANDSGLFATRKDMESSGWRLNGNIFERDGARYLPLYEAKMVHQFDHRYGDYSMRLATSEGTQLPEVPLSKLQDSAYVPMPRYWVAEDEVLGRLQDRWGRPWLLGWRDIARNTDERTLIATIIPKAAVGHKFPLMLPTVSPHLVGALLTCLNSLVVDYVARQKIGGTNFAIFNIKQLPIPTPQQLIAPCPWDEAVSAANWFGRRAARLLATAADMAAPLAEWGVRQLRSWSADERSALRAEIDAAWFMWFGLDMRAIDQVLDSFPVLERKEVREFGEYVTRRQVVEAFRALATGSELRSVS